MAERFAIDRKKPVEGVGGLFDRGGGLGNESPPKIVVVAGYWTCQSGLTAAEVN